VIKLFSPRLKCGLNYGARCARVRARGEKARAAEEAPTRQTARGMKLFRPRIKRAESPATVCGIFRARKKNVVEVPRVREINGPSASQGSAR